ncbi:hypothetical protein C8J56DRAFT_889379 [Mycena floridula]|nr:hypothetical protein C8J56DRAFT_889379 [Mycena floridula]
MLKDPFNDQKNIPSATLLKREMIRLLRGGMESCEALEVVFMARIEAVLQAGRPGLRATTLPLSNLLYWGNEVSEQPKICIWLPEIFLQVTVCLDNHVLVSESKDPVIIETSAKPMWFLSLVHEAATAVNNETNNEDLD